jgi:hypothetical protein
MDSTIEAGDNRPREGLAVQPASIVIRNESRPKRQPLVVATGGLLVAVAAGAMAAAGGAADGARKAPAAFRLVFDGKHTPALQHEGPFTTSASFCLAGSAADISVESSTDTAVRLRGRVHGPGEPASR